MRYEDTSHTGGIAQGQTPEARNDIDKVPAGSHAPALGNILTGDGTETGAAGADSANHGRIVEISGVGGHDASFANGKLEVAGEYGKLSIDANGDYRYLPNAKVPENVQDRFIYTLADAAGVRSTASLTIEFGKTPTVVRADATKVVPGPDGMVVLPAGVELADIHVVGRNLVIDMPDGTQMVIIDGAVFVPQLVLDGVEVPPTNLAALLIGSEPKPAAGGEPPSSGGNFEVPVPPLDPGVPLGDLIPPTQYAYQPPEVRDIIPGSIDHDPVITIDPGTGVPVEDAVASVNEAGLPARGSEPAGSNAAANSESTSGTIIIDSPDTPNTVTINGVAVTSVGQVIHGAYGDLTITSISGSAIGYSYTLLDNTSGDTTHDDFTVVVTDVDGDSDTATLHIDIIDDVPTARPDTDSIAAGEFGPATGNVITDASAGDAGDSDSGADTVGADNATVTAVSGAGGSDSSYDEDGNLVVNGQYGVLTINADGSYSYVRNEGTPGGVQDVFNYTLTDGDGDTSSSTLTISIADASPITGQNATVLLDDDALAGGNPGGVGDDADSANTSGVLAGSGGDGSLTFALGSGGAPAGFSYALQANGDLWVLQGTTHVLTVHVDSATGAYTVTQVNPIDHAAGGDENNAVFTINYTVTDVDGDHAGGTLTINVDDDTPTIDGVLDREAQMSVDESGPASAATINTGSVTKGDDPNVAGSGAIGHASSGVAILDLNASFGADGPAAGGGLSYGLNVTNANSGLTLTDGSAIQLVELPNGVVVGVVQGGAFNGQAAFAISIDSSTGVVTVEQYLSLDHPLNPDPNDPLGLGQGTLAVVGTATDGDGDTVSTGNIDISNLITFLDDGPSIDPALNANATVTVDESAPSSTPGINLGGITAGDDPDLPGGLALGQATSGSAVVNANAAFGADGPAAGSGISYALTITSTNPGVTLTDGTPIELQMVGGVIVGVVQGGTFDGQAAFAIAINPATGVVTVEQYLSLDHPLNPNPNDPLGLGDNTVGVTVTATDGDGDSVTSGAIDISGQITFLDDGPSIDPVLNAQAHVTLDESGPSAVGTLNLGGIVAGDDPDRTGSDALSAGNSGVAVVDANAVFGADGPALKGSLGYALSITNAASGLTLTDGSAIQLQMVNGVIVGVVQGGAFDGQAAFAIGINASTGVVTVEQYLSLDHPLNPNPNDPLGLGAGTIAVTVTATDGDGDSVSSGAIDISGTVTFLDDGPSVSGSLNPDGHILLDESGPSATSTIATGVIVHGDDPDVAGSGAIAKSSSAAAIVLPSAAFGADGPALTDSLTYALSVTNAASGLTLTDGSAIQLQMVNGVIVGVVQGGAFAGQAAFAISINSSTGVVTVEQYLSLDHPVNPDPNDPLGLAAGTIAVTLTATDGDGDTASSGAIDISGMISFLDDGPDAHNDVDTILGGANSTDGNVITGAGTDGGTGGAGADALGADGKGGVTAIASNNVPAATSSVDGSGNLVIHGQYGTLTIAADGTYTYVRDAGGPGGVSDVFTYTLTDGDGDPVTATLTIGIQDARPHTDPNPNVLLDDDALSGGNANGTGDDVDAQNVSGFLSGSGGDGALTWALVGSGAPGGFSYSMQPNGDLWVMQGTTHVLTVTLNAATGAYTVTQVAPIDHVAGGDENNQLFTISYTVTDQDGDSAGGSVVINVDDDTPTVSANATVQLDDDALANGNTGGTGDDADSANVSGTLAHSYGADGAGSIAFSLAGAPAGFSYALQPNGDLWVMQGTTHVLTVTLNTTTGAYSVSQVAPIVHPAGSDENNVSFTIGYVVTDHDGDSVNGSLTINVDDDTPLANADSDNVPAGTYAVITGNVISGVGTNEGTANADRPGADGFGGVTTIHSNGSSQTDTTFSAGLLSIHGSYGTLTMDANGNYTYTRDAGTPGGVDDVFTYTYQDADGDAVTTTLTIHIGDATLTPHGAINVQLDDDALAGGNAGGTGDDADAVNVSGSAAATGGDGPLAYALLTTGAPGGFSYSLQPSGDLWVMQGTTHVLTVHLDASTGAYSVSQVAPIVHPAGGDENNVSFVINYSVTDQDSDTANGVININVDDDTPTINVTQGSDANVHLITQDADTIGVNTDTATSTANFSGVFGLSFSAGADGASVTPTLSYALGVSSQGVNSGLTAHGQTIFLYTIGGVVVGSTSATQGGVNAGNTVFDVSVGSTGIVTLNQYSQIDHPIAQDPSPTGSPFVDQGISLADGLITLTASSSITDNDGDTASDSETVNIGANLTFQDDGPTASSFSVNQATENSAVIIPLAGHYTGGADGVDINNVANVSFTQPASGTVTYDATTGQFTFTPLPGQEGTVTFTYTVKDFDGDTATATVTITLQPDSVPQVTNTAAAVDDDGLAGGIAGGTGDIDANQGEASPVNPSEAIFHGQFVATAGGDTIANYSLAAMNNTNGTVGTESVHYTWNAGTNTLTATITSGARTGTDLFKVVVNPTTGSYDLTLLDNVLHAAGGNETSTSANLTFTVTDSDGDAANGTLAIVFNDDTPTLGTVQSQQTDNNPATTPAVGTLHFAAGADGAGSTMTITADTTGLASGGHSLVTHQVGNVLYAYQDVGPAGYDAGDTTVVFTITVDPNAGTSGQYTFDLVTALDPTVTPFNVQQDGAFGVGPSQSVVVTDSTGNNIVFVTGWSPTGGFTPAEIAAWEGGASPTVTQTSNVNGSNQGWGLGNNNFDVGEFMRFDFGPLNDYDGAGGYTPPGGVYAHVSYADFTFKNFTGTDKIIIVAHYTDGTTSSIEILGSSGLSHYQVNAPAGQEIAWVDVYQSNGDMKLNLGTIGIIQESLDKTIHATVQLTDGDGDPTTTGSFDIHIASGLVPFAPAAPVVIDMNGDGVHFLGQSAGVTYDYGGDGVREATAWASAGDAILVRDANGNGTVDGASEFVFGHDGLTDLQALRAAYGDTLDANDAAYASFGVWQDANSNGRVDAGEYHTLAQAGITSISLVSDGVAYSAAGGDVSVAGTTIVTRADGSTGSAADASFATGSAAAAATADQRLASSSSSSLMVAAAVAAAGLADRIAYIEARAAQFAERLGDGMGSHDLHLLGGRVGTDGPVNPVHSLLGQESRIAVDANAELVSASTVRAASASHDQHASLAGKAAALSQLSELLGATHGNTAHHDGPAFTAANVVMPSAQALAAASGHGADANAMAGKVVAAALTTHSPTSVIDALLQSLPDNGLGKLPALQALASHGPDHVQTWDMGQNAGFVTHETMMSKMGALLLHHDAVQPTAHG